MANWWEQALQTGYGAGRAIGPDVINKAMLAKKAIANQSKLVGTIGEAAGLPRYPVEQVAEDPMRAIRTITRGMPATAPWFLMGDVIRGFANEPTGVKGIVKGIASGVAPEQVPMKHSREAMLDRGAPWWQAGLAGTAEDLSYWGPAIMGGINRLAAPKGLTAYDPKGPYNPLFQEGTTGPQAKVARLRELQKMRGWGGKTLDPTLQTEYDTLMDEVIRGRGATLHSLVPVPDKQQVFGFVDHLKQIAGQPTSAMEKGISAGMGISRLDPNQLAWGTKATPGTTLAGMETPGQVYERLETKGPPVGLDPEHTIIDASQVLKDAWGKQSLVDMFGTLKDHIQISADHPGLEELADTYAEEFAHAIRGRKGLDNDAVIMKALGGVNKKEYQRLIHPDNFDQLKELVLAHLFEDFAPGAEFTGAVAPEPEVMSKWDQGLKTLQDRFTMGKARVEDAIQRLTPFKEPPITGTEGLEDLKERIPESTIRDMAQIALERGLTKEQFLDQLRSADIYDNNISDGRVAHQPAAARIYDELAKGGAEVGGKVDPLTESARKAVAEGKTVEEFVKNKASGEAYYRDMELMKVSDVVPFKEYDRLKTPSSSQAEREKLKQDIAKNGIKEPLILEVDRSGNIRLTEGNNRLEIAQELGIENVPVQVHRYSGEMKRGGDALPLGTVAPAETAYYEISDLYKQLGEQPKLKATMSPSELGLKATAYDKAKAEVGGTDLSKQKAKDIIPEQGSKEKEPSEFRSRGGHLYYTSPDQLKVGDYVKRPKTTMGRVVGFTEGGRVKVQHRNLMGEWIETIYGDPSYTYYDAKQLIKPSTAEIEDTKMEEGISSADPSLTDLTRATFGKTQSQYKALSPLRKAPAGTTMQMPVEEFRKIYGGDPESGMVFTQDFPRKIHYSVESVEGGVVTIKKGMSLDFPRQKAKEPSEMEQPEPKAPEPGDGALDLFGDPIQDPTAPAAPSTPDGEQMEFDLNGFPFKRFYRPVGIGQKFANPNLYAHHAGIGPEHDILSTAYDQYTVKKAELREQRAIMDRMFKDSVSWFQQSKIPDLKKEFELILENPQADFSSLPPQLQELGKQMRREFDQMFLEENAARRMRGEQEYPYRQGYIRRLYEDKVMEMIQKNQEPDTTVTGGFEYGLKAQMKFGPEEQRTDFESGRLFDPVESFIRRKEEHYREMLIKPALIKVQENVNKLAAQKHPVPPDLIKNLNDFIKYTIKGVELPHNERWNNSLNTLNKYLFNVLGDRPFTNATDALLKIQYLGTLWGNLRQYTRNPLQSVHHISMYGIPNALKAGVRMLRGARAEGSLEKEIRNPFLLDRAKGWMQKVQDIGFAPLRQTDMFNIIHAAETARAWAESLASNPGWIEKMRKLAIKHGLPEDAYQWKQPDINRESEFGMQVAQYKYAVTGRPEIYRQQEMKAIGGLFSWPMNYWGTFGRELCYRFFTGRTGWADSNGIHKPIPTAARLAAGQYLLLMGTINALLGKAGMDYSSQFFLGVVPTGANPVTQVALGLVGLSMGSYRLSANPYDRRAKKLVGESKYRLQSGMGSMLPGAASVKKTGKVISGEEPWWTLFTYPKYEPESAMPTRQNVRRGIHKDVEKPPTRGSFMDD
jgi:hypothetical protein